jgi:DNA repair protein RecN (Recombination protein N)
MLSSLSIKNIALITECEISLGKGLVILSGETGAGKSIIIDSLTFVLGDRADKSLIRSGENTATVEAVFDIELNEKLVNCMTELGIEPENTVIIRRTMTLEGRNDCKVNGKSVTLGMLRKLTAHLADIYGQHEHQSILNVDSHILLLDEYGNLGGMKERVSEKYKETQVIKSELDKFGSEDEIRRKLDTLEFQIKEISDADLKEGEEEELLAMRAKFMSAEKIIGGVSGAYNLLSGAGETADSLARSARSLLISIEHLDPLIAELGARLDSAAIELQDISASLKDYSDAFDYDERKADIIEKRIDLIRLMRKKYGADPSAYLDKAKTQYDLLFNSGEAIEELNKKLSAFNKKLEALALELTNARISAGQKFAGDIINELNDLGMKGTTFKVNIDTNNYYMSESGCDKVEFMISPNPGEPLKPLSRIISGGEMSRFMLAVKNITARLDNIDCMVFDEIDSGISGHIAQVVSEKLANIAMKRQVIAVTHLPQLAAMADRHYLIEKSTDGLKTVTKLSLLGESESIKEVARLIGGSDYSGFAVPHAGQMKSYAGEYKKTINS